MRLQQLTQRFGLEATDVSIPVNGTQAEELKAALFDGRVLVLRGQRLDADEFLSFARIFGRPEPHVIDQFHHPRLPEILILSNVTRDGAPTGLADAGTYWHTDYSYLAQPALATTLYSIEVPSVGGDTLFADMRSAYEDLPASMKTRIDGMMGLHVYGNRDDLDPVSRTAASPLNARQWSSMRLVRHPLVRRHPVTGRKALYAVSGTSIGIEGMPEGEALSLLNELKAHATQQRYQLRLKYAVGDVVIWDNASLLHSATLTPASNPRTLWRITIMEH